MLTDKLFAHNVGPDVPCWVVAGTHLTFFYVLEEMSEIT